MTESKTDSRKSLEVAKELEVSSDRKSDIEVQTACEDIYEDGTVDPVYQAKARLLNIAIQEIGMGRYQVRPQLSLHQGCHADNLPPTSGISSSSPASAGLRTYSDAPR